MDLNELEARLHAKQADMILKFYTMYDFSYRWTPRDDLIFGAFFAAIIALLIVGLV